jgi:tetratricopeptide (TPR) repeat protein
MLSASFLSERSSSKKVFAAEEETNANAKAQDYNTTMMKTDTDQSEKRSSALRSSKRQTSPSSKFANGNGIRAVSFSEDRTEDTTPKKAEQEKPSSTSPSKSLSPKRGNFLNRTKRTSKNNNNNKNQNGSCTSEKENNNDKSSVTATDETGTPTKSSSPRKWGSRRFRKGFSLFGNATGERWNGYGTLEDSSNNIEENDAETPSAAEADPVMTIFEKRNTQRVRFTLGGDGESVISDSDGEKKGNTDKRGEGSNGAANNNNSSSAGNIKQFMSRALFGSNSKSGAGSPSSKKLSEEEMKREVKELGGGSLIWESATTPTGPEVIHTKNNRKNQQTTATPELTVSFTEDPKARAAVAKLLSKASKAEHSHFRYEYAVKCYLKALNILQKQAKYPDNHPTVVKTVSLMNNAHHVLSSYNNSANIVKMGIKNEDAGELVKALKMYTIAYRIRRDNLSRNHPSLVVLLNMLGSIQIKRGELQEAMQIYELALKDDQVVSSGNVQFEAQNDSHDTFQPPTTDRNLLAKSVTFREMGTIYEMWGNVNEALKFYHKSLDCVAEWREKVKNNFSPKKSDGSPNNKSASQDNGTEPHDYSIDNVQTISGVGDEEMELVIGSAKASQKDGASNSKSENKYERFFPKKMDAETKNEPKASDENSHADMDLSLTLHQIAQLYRTQGKFDRALDAYEVALRGMKMALGKHHPNVAAVLGNIGNLQKEMGDLGAAYKTYQEVLGIESYRLGLSHPDVAITLHNIATIDAARGNYEHSLQLYRKVIGLQKKLFGEENLSVAVTAACMGDVYEKIGDLKSSMASFDEAVRIKSAILGRHSLDVGRLLHKLGKLSFLTDDYLEAESFIARTLLIYRLNKLDENHEWFIDANRDAADIDGAIAVGNDQCEI